MKIGGPVIAVDGPAAAGKGTLARQLAEVLKLPYLDTGLLYRAVTWKVLEAGAKPTDPAETFARALTIEDTRRSGLRSPEVTQAVSNVAAQPAVREALVDIQRHFAATHGGVLDGRDIGTVIFPKADVKFFITASLPTRALRRFLQVGGDITAPDASEKLHIIEDSLKTRDHVDTNRENAPLCQAHDAYVIETDTMDAASVLSEALRIVRERLGTPLKTI